MEITVKNSVEISLTLLQKFVKKLPFDIYIKRGGERFTKIFKKGDSIDWSRVERYFDKGIESFFCLDADYKIYGLYVEKVGELLKEKIERFDRDESIEFIKEMAHFTMHEFQQKTKIDTRLMDTANNVVQSCIQSLDRDPKSLVRILSMMSSQTYLIKHSLATSLFAIMLAKKAGVQADSTLGLIGLGALLHDIGEAQLAFDPEETENLSGEERRELWRHPEMGKRMLDGVKGIKEEVSMIILQHHEQPNGHGYPNGLRGAEIYYPAKIVSIADCFASLISKRSYREAFTSSQAIAKMKEDHGKFDRQLLRDLEELFIQKRQAA